MKMITGTYFFYSHSVNVGNILNIITSELGLNMLAYSFYLRHGFTLDAIVLCFLYAFNLTLDGASGYYLFV